MIKKLTIIIAMLMASSAWAKEGEISDTQSNTENSIYLACEAGKKNAWSYKPGPHTLKDLLENKIDLTLNKKRKKLIKKGFKYKSNDNYYKKRLYERKQSVPLEYVDKMFDFVALKITDNSYKDEKTICTSSNGYLSWFTFGEPKRGYEDDEYNRCHFYEETETGDQSRIYQWELESYNVYESARKTIDRETLIYHDYRRTIFPSGGSSSSSERYKCYISNLDQINILEANYKDYLKPFEEEWQRLVSEFLLKEKVINDKNKI